jgi:hypothetical protein
MKQKDIIIIVVVAIVSGIFSYGIASFLFGGQKTYNLKAPTVDVITAEFKLPNAEYFNKESIDLTKNINIGDPGNPTPFNSSKP